MKALVTGGGGFLGSYVVRLLLDEGWEVRVFELPGVKCEAARAAGAEIVHGDLARPEDARRACAGRDVVFHVAALAAMWGPREAFERANVLATRNVIEGCRAERVPRLVQTSSPSAVFCGENHAGADESLPYPTKGQNHYGRTKAEAEKLVLAANDSSLKTTSLRPHIIWGPGDTQILPRLMQRAEAGRLVRVGDGKNLVSLTFVENAARAHLLAAASDRAAGRAYFVTDGEPVNLWDFIGRILAELDLPPPRFALPHGAARLAATLLEAFWALARRPGEPPVTRYSVDELALTHYYDISRARRDLGYEPPVGMEEGFRRTMEWWREKKAASR